MRNKREAAFCFSFRIAAFLLHPFFLTQFYSYDFKNRARAAWGRAQLQGMAPGSGHALLDE
jgi:hypothetical protein